MRVLGIDPGSSITGYGIVDEAGGKLLLYECGIIRAQAARPFSDKLKRIYDGLTEVILKCRPDIAVVENIFLSKNVKSAIKMGHARGVAMLACANAGLSVFEYTPLEIKMAVVGYGVAEKSQVQEMVKRILSLDKISESEDASDAVAAAICHIHSAKLREIMDKA